MSQRSGSRMRDEEVFVAEALVGHLGGPSRASYRDGEDPPDIAMCWDGNDVGVEVTRLTQRTFRNDGSLGNRASDDAFGLRLIDDLNLALGQQLPGDLDLLIHLEMPVENGGRFRASLTSWMQSVVASAKPGVKSETVIDKTQVRAKFIPRRKSEKRIVGIVWNRQSSPDIALNARIVLENRIAVKNESCKGLSGTLWLALLNNYWLADGATYRREFAKLRIKHCFARVFLVGGDGRVTQL